MKQLMKIGMLMAALLMVIACKESAVEQWIIRAEENMEVNADSAYRCLHHAMEANGWNDALRARYALRYTQAMHKCRIPLEGDSLINTAVAYYTKSHDRHRLALSFLYKGLAHKQRKEVVKAAEAFALSEQWFEGVEDDQYKALLYNHYGDLMMKEENFDNALTYFKKSYEFNLKGDSLHYIVDACNVIATIFKLQDKPDSAKSYYEKGLQYEGKVSLQRFSSFKNNYANFLRENGEYEKAEQMLHECEPYITGERRYSLYSSLATLYYKTKDYDNALAYAEKMKESTDSLMVRTCFLHLYRIFKQKNQIDSAVYYHDLYRKYDSDITMRMKTAEVAAIPNRVKSEILKEKNHALTGWRTWLLVAIVGVISVAWWMLKRTRYRHRCEQQVKNDELNMVGKKLGETSAELGRLKGALTNQVDAINRMKEEHRKVLDKQKDEIERLKKKVEQQKNEINEKKKSDSFVKQNEDELKRTLKKMEYELDKRTAQLATAEYQREIDQRIECFMMRGRDAVAVDLLLQLRHNSETCSRFDIKPSEYLPLLKTLLEQEEPTLHSQLENCRLPNNKLTMCYLMALGLDDIDMMSRAACLAPNSVKAYRKECREVVYSNERKRN